MSNIYYPHYSDPVNHLYKMSIKSLIGEINALYNMLILNVLTETSGF